MNRLTVCAALLLACSDSTPSPTIDAAGDAAADAPIQDGLPAPPAIAVDGLFEDWNAVPNAVEDPAGDATGGFDLKKVKATSRGTAIFIYLEIAETLNAHNGPPSEGNLVVDLAGDGGRLTIDLRGRVAFKDGDPANNVKWSELGYRIAPTYASKRFELRADLAAIEAKLGEPITVTFSGSDSLPAAIDLTLAHPALDHTLRTAARDDKTQLRVASLNTWLDGITDPTRNAAMGRLIRAVAADIYCFQEVFNATPGAVAAALETIDPHDDGAAWNVYPQGDLIIASRDALEPVPPTSSFQPYAGVGAEIGGERVVIFTLRPVCCGYIGDPADQQRIAEIKALASTIDKLRQGQLGAELGPWQNAPAIVIGDWNLVGSRAPLDLMTAAGLSHWQLRHLLGDDVFTWRSFKDKNFAPGMLDLIVHSPTGLERGNGFVLDTAELDAKTLGELGLQVTDSRTSDHLLLVADFSVK